MQVLKFGGTSVANAENILKVAEIVSRAVDKDRTILVCSAISGFTDALIRIGTLAARRDISYTGIIEDYRARHREIISKVLPVEKHEEIAVVCDKYFDSLRDISHGVYLLGELSATSLDAIQSFGELLSTKIISTKLASLGISTKWVDAREVIKVKDGVVDSAVTYGNVRNMVEANPIVSLFVLPGFIAADDRDRTTTLGRGGSDYTASLLAVGCNARILEIWTDVDGMMTSNPKIVPAAHTITNISYRAALELSHFGAKVIYPPTIQPVVSEGIPIYVKNTFNPDSPGTLIEKNPPRSHEKIIGISNSDKIALISLEGSGMVGVPGFSGRLFDTLSQSGINIILITQASSVHTMCVAVSEKDADKAKEAADKAFAYEISLGKLNPLKIEKGYSIICLVGDDIRNQSGTTARMLSALGRHSIPVRAAAQGSSERNISIIVPSPDADAAIAHIHHEFFEKSMVKDVNLFIAGYGTVGKALMKIISTQRDSILRRTGLRLNIAGLSNSRKFRIELGGISLEDANHLLENGLSAADDAYFEALAKTSLENSVFVDCTASSDISYKYLNLFKRGYSVVACNKITFSAPYAQYKALKDAALASGVSLKYETTVGAALPILETVTRCVNSGDRIQRVDAVLSGTMNYLFSSYEGGPGVTPGSKTFAQVVRDAQAAGYTEPDPRLDLSGRDVLRKLLIMGRETGMELDEKDVDINPLLGPEYFEGGVDAFYSKVEAGEEYFSGLYKDAAGCGKKLRFVASLTDDGQGNCRAAMGLEQVGPEHPLYNLGGTDNAAILTTDFYPSPLVVQGAGAGAFQTASGVLNDILLGRF